MARNLTSLTGNANTPIWELNQYTKRPVWEFVGMGPSTPNAYRSVFAENDPVNYIEALGVGAVSGVRSRSFARNTDEVANSSIYISGSSTVPPTASSRSPWTAIWGITGFADTGSCNNWYSNEAGEFGYTQGLDVADTLARSVHVTPIDGKNRNYEMVLHGTKLRIGPIGGAWSLFFADNNGTASSLSRFFDLSVAADTGIVFGAFAGTNYGMASYNANTGVFTAMYGMNDSSKTYRIHSWELGRDALHKDLTYDAIRALFVAAKPSYCYADLTLATMTNTYTAAGDHAQHRLIACNDGTMWLAMNDKAGSSGVLTLRTYKIKADIRQWAKGAVNTLANPAHFEPVNAVSSTTHYGLDSGSFYSTKNMLSDDNKYTAVYSHYVNYCFGAIAHILPNTSVNDRYVMASFTETTSGRSIAPIGGSKFVFNNTYNQDGAITNMLFIDPTNATQANGYLYSSGVNSVGQYLMYASSTNYNACFVNKILPLSLYK